MKPLEQDQNSEPVVEDIPEPEAPGFIAASETEDLLDLESTPIQEQSVDAPEEIMDLSSGIDDSSEIVEEEPVEETPVQEVAADTAAEDPVVIEEAGPTVIPEPIVVPASGAYYQSEAMHADEPRPFTDSRTVTKEDDGGYYVTVIQEKNGRQRNMLLLGATFLVLTTAIISWGVSLFQKDLFVASIGDDYPLSSLIDSVPMPVDEIKEEKKDSDEGGGGGGGGKDQKDPVSLGDLANQTKTPLRPPSATTYRSDDTELKLPQASTEGTRKFPQEYDRYGDPNSRFGGLSDGPGTGGGMGTGRGTGQGSGRGTGAGSGTGSGYGDGVGDGEGSGRGSGGGPPPRAIAGPSTPLEIVSKPSPGYTDEARKNNVTGKVRLRVTFLANGQIGQISVVQGLPNGLTEKAIAAARAIKFQPRKDSGIAKSVTRQIEYNFTIY